MKQHLFKLKLLQRVFVLLLFAGLSGTGKANATCIAKIQYAANKLAVTFSDSGSTGLADAHTTSWSFGDSATASTDDPTHTYSKAGTYHVCVTIYDSKTSCSATYCTNVTVYSTTCSLVASYTYSVVSVSNRTVKFTSTGSSSSTMKYAWNFDDGTTDTTVNDTVTHKFSGTGNSYSVYLYIYDTKTACSASYSSLVTLCNANSRIGWSSNEKTVTFSGDSANNTKDTYAWTLGDGSTRADMHFNYTYASYGTYSVCVTVTDPTQGCSTKTCNTITIAAPTYCISGSVSAGTGPIAPFEVYLISFNATDSSLTAIDSVKVLQDSDQYYQFCNVTNGTYYTKAALLPKSPKYSSYVPTYHNDALRWKTAVAITVSGASVTNVNINMKSGTNSGGPGFIGGKISAGANKVGDPISAIEVVLYDANSNPVGYTYSDANGLYSFTNLAYGTYSIEADIPGKTDYPLSITISAANPKPAQADLIVNSKTIKGVDLSGIDQAIAPSNAMVYPNPVTDNLRIETNLQAAQNATVRIYDETGKIILTTGRNLPSGKQTLDIDASAWHNGIYFVKIQLQKDNQTLETRFVKAQ